MFRIPAGALSALRTPTRPPAPTTLVPLTRDQFAEEVSSEAERSRFFAPRRRRRQRIR